MAEKNFNQIVDSLLTGMDGFLSSKTVVGEPLEVNGATIIPFVDVSFGVGAGNFRGEKKDNGAGGISGKMSPSAVLIIANGTTRIVNIKNQDGLTKILDMIPDIINNYASKKNQLVSDEEAANKAFPDNDTKPEE
ncbi:MAG: GerW family sporulation protein [Lachnospiraceae bacterium]|nr:GerW family sporulation protein [Lachnospiraceae bacterium]